LLVGERSLLDLISTGAPLAHVLDMICAAFDPQMGNVVSLVLLSDDEAHTTLTIAQSAAHFELSVFRCVAIVSPSSEELLGTLEMYCGFPGTPTSSEDKLIERTAHLAALAIQGHIHERNSGSLSLPRNGAMGRSSPRGPRFKN
jgi:GAF domain-containing protein